MAVLATTRRAGWDWSWALLAGFVLRAGFMAIHARFQGDTLVYGDLAGNLLRYGVYGLTEHGHVRATLIRLPGYPLFLAACFAVFGVERYLPVLWVQVGVDLLGCWLLGRTAGRLFGARVGLVCLWDGGALPVHGELCGYGFDRDAVDLCVIAAFRALVGWRDCVRKGGSGLAWAGALGAALSASVLLRPDGILLSGAVLPAMAWVAWRRSSERPEEQIPRAEDGRGTGDRSSGWWGIPLSAGLLLVCLGLWTARNWRVYHVVQSLAPKYANDPGEPSPIGFARWYRTWGTGLGDTARVYWEYDGSALHVIDLPPWAIDSPAEREETAAIYARYNDETSSTPAVEVAFAALARERERAHPLRSLVAMPLARLGDMWLRPRTELLPRMPVSWWKPRLRPRATTIACVLGLLNLLLLAAAVRGLWVWWRARWLGQGVVAAAMVGYVVLRSGLLLTIDNSEPRYVLEGYPVVILLAALAVAGREVIAEGRPTAPEGWPGQRTRRSLHLQHAEGTAQR